jgi:hypothetical protein
MNEHRSASFGGDSLGSLSRRERAELYRSLGAAARKDGRPNLALGYFVESYALRKTQIMRRRIDALSNEFGMAKQTDPCADDWQAFYCIHLRRYVASKKSKKLGTLAESDMIRELIHEHWQRVQDSQLTVALSPDQRLLLYEKIVIVFPYFDVPEHMNDSTVHVDFNRKGRMLPAVRCSCGSGLAFKLCCGRIPGTDEIEIGRF